MSTSHIHKTVETIALSQSSNPSSLLTAQSHESNHLVSLVRSGCNSATSPIQKAAKSEYDAESNGIYYLSASSCISDDSVLQAYLCLFDNLFFFGSITARTSVYVTTSFLRYETGYRAGVTNESGTDITIAISKQNRGDRRARLTEYLGTLLHEMCHAFFLLYACRADDCDRKTGAQACDGHGPAWIDMANGVRSGASSMLGLWLELDIMESKIREEMINAEAAAEGPSRL